jgi:NAD(P)-dependent dehydrogenase (short-subunit alcohol dehydrogenase family)
MSKSVIVIGAGPGIGGAVARRFARQGFSVGLIGRQQQTLDAVAVSLRAFDAPAVMVTADSADDGSLRAGLDEVRAQLGPPQVVVYNAAVIRPDRPDELTMRDVLETWAVNVGGAVVAAAHLLPEMAGRREGSYFITGGMPAPDPRYTTLSLGKAGVRALVALLDAQFGSAGVHVASVTVTDVVVPGTGHDPDLIAEHYWRLHTQPPGSWQHEIIH